LIKNKSQWHWHPIPSLPLPSPHSLVNIHSQKRPMGKPTAKRFVVWSKIQHKNIWVHLCSFANCQIFPTTEVNTPNPHGFDCALLLLLLLWNGLLDGACGFSQNHFIHFRWLSHYC
jgi:hypothetical protein